MEKRTMIFRSNAGASTRRIVSWMHVFLIAWSSSFSLERLGDALTSISLPTRTQPSQISTAIRPREPAAYNGDRNSGDGGYHGFRV